MVPSPLGPHPKPPYLRHEDLSRRQKLGGSRSSRADWRILQPEILTNIHHPWKLVKRMETILSVWVLAYFQGRAVNFREGSSGLSFGPKIVNHLFTTRVESSAKMVVVMILSRIPSNKENWADDDMALSRIRRNPWRKIKMYLCRCSHHKRYHTKFQDKEMTTLHTMGFSGIAMPLMEAYRMSAWGVGTKSCNTSLQRNYSRRPLHGSLKSSTSNFPHQVVDIQRIQEFNYRKYNYNKSI